MEEEEWSQRVAELGTRGLLGDVSLIVFVRVKNMVIHAACRANHWPSFRMGQNAVFARMHKYLSVVGV